MTRIRNHVACSEFRVEEFKTPARGLLTVPELLQAMGDHSIGTAGSIANHIAKLINDYYYLKVADAIGVKRCQ